MYEESTSRITQSCATRSTIVTLRQALIACSGAKVCEGVCADIYFGWAPPPRVDSQIKSSRRREVVSVPGLLAAQLLDAPMPPATS